VQERAGTSTSFISALGILRASEKALDRVLKREFSPDGDNTYSYDDYK
jgi:hypothetical protein